jgi:branched-chain amino acid transport system permease protein
MDIVGSIAVQIFYMIAILALISSGLAIIFGMMRVINLAHGEFLMLGAYAVVVATNAGVNIWISMFIIAPIFVGIVGVIVERLVIRFLYGRMMDTLLATWALSLLFIGVMTTIFGNATQSITAPVGTFSMGDYSESVYRLLIIAFAVVLMLGIYLVLRHTRLGLIARGTMQNADMASALGISPQRVYTITFGLGAALTGFAGAVLAPVSGLLPTMGVTYIAKAFITVIGGGQVIVTGTSSAAVLFGTVNQVTTILTTPVIGTVALFVVALILLRALPQGITGRFFRRGL